MDLTAQFLVGITPLEIGPFGELTIHLATTPRGFTLPLPYRFGMTSMHHPQYSDI